ncbi:hypothetical protein [Kushneria aurantia]|uniref:Uncharacterized protein n=1 Tax=Kushneria aurantia TaxID=504092 RepID=A0ABV6FZJ6_9GAMM|nr:hypothetical protein [Kushneria aurantia]
MKKSCPTTAGGQVNSIAASCHASLMARLLAAKHPGPALLVAVLALPPQLEWRRYKSAVIYIARHFLIATYYFANYLTEAIQKNNFIFVS